MRLKEYQVQALETLSKYLNALAAEHVSIADILKHVETLPAGTRKAILETVGDPVVKAWAAAQAAGIVASQDEWRPMKDGTGRSVPHVCLKLPTGGGKTLLASHGVDRILVSYFRRTTGFVLWIVPSDAIYTQTKKQLSDRGSAVRQVLDRMSGGRVKILEKLDGFTKQDVEDKLCVLLLMLPSANRETRDSLKVFRDSGRYESFFPQDDPAARAALLKEVPNLDEIDLAEAAAGGADTNWIKHSLGNALRIVRPVIVLDEGHRTYGQLARETLRTLNPRFILELTATPKREFANILVNVSGRALKDEEMIKLPIRLDVTENASWKDTLQAALDRLSKLGREAQALEAETNRYIRPIMLVRVDRTGKDQRGGDYVHSLDVVEQLTNKLNVARDAIRIQTADVKELKQDDDLLSPYSPVRVIVTKDALREGWDCPFAYVLAILSGGNANTALTQMIGRVLRQPYAERTGREMLDEAHVFCADVKVRDAVARIKKGLEDEGMGDLGDEIKTGGGVAGASAEKEIRMRKAFRGSRIMVPRVLHRTGKKQYRELDFEMDILPAIDWDKFAWRGAETFNLADYDLARRAEYDIDIASAETFGLEARARQSELLTEAGLDRAALVRRMLDVVPNPWQGMRILDDALARLRKRGAIEAELVAAKYELVRSIRDDIETQFDEAAEHVFKQKLKSGEIVFKLVGAPFDELNFEFDELVKVRVTDADKPLFRHGMEPLERSLYDMVLARELNGFEQEVALYLDAGEAVDWWWRIVARRGWALQGWRRNRVYPDFLVKLESDGDTARLLVLETKGQQLAGAADTVFKEKLFAALESAYASGKEAGDVELFADAPVAMKFRILLQQDAWKSELEEAFT